MLSSDVMTQLLNTVSNLLKPSFKHWLIHKTQFLATNVIRWIVLNPSGVMLLQWQNNFYCNKNVVVWSRRMVKMVKSCHKHLLLCHFKLLKIIFLLKGQIHCKTSKTHSSPKPALSSVWVAGAYPIHKKAKVRYTLYSLPNHCRTTQRQIASQTHTNIQI